MFEKYKRDQKRWTPADFGVVILLILVAVLGPLAFWSANHDEPPHDVQLLLATPSQIDAPPAYIGGSPTWLWGSTERLTVGEYHTVTFEGNTFEACALRRHLSVTYLTTDRDDAQAACGIHPAQR